jgi:hypothetical protein
MTKRFEELVLELCRELQLLTCNFLEKHVDDGEKITDVINLVSSAHMSSWFRLIAGIADGSDSDKTKTQVNNFINDLQTYISKLHQVSNIKVL